MSDLDLVRHIAELNRQDREVPHEFARAALAGDRKGLVAAGIRLDSTSYGWRSALRLCAKLDAVPADTKRGMLTLWCSYGDHLRGEVMDGYDIGEGAPCPAPAL
jgi:hypothetical protein